MKKLLLLHVTIHAARQRLLFRLMDLYGDREANAIADMVMESVTGWKKIDRIIHKQVPLSMPQSERLDNYSTELMAGRPVQYVLQEAWFCSLKFHVDERVLIPRPETEELVEWILREGPDPDIVEPRVVDLGTGSGCIAVALKKKWPRSLVYGYDISEPALQVARLNATAHQTEVLFKQLDILDPGSWQTLPEMDILVSNPPYIPLSEKQDMLANVVDFEPHQALFTPDHAPLVFYEAMAVGAKKKLRPGGKVFAEIHENFHSDIKELFSFLGFTDVEIRKDMQGKHRMLKATWLL